eukprot:7599391-Alexandrium_andersonii.AAC.1
MLEPASAGASEWVMTLRKALDAASEAASTADWINDAWSSSSGEEDDDESRSTTARAAFAGAGPSADDPELAPK